MTSYESGRRFTNRKNTSQAGYFNNTGIRTITSKGGCTFFMDLREKGCGMEQIKIWRNRIPGNSKKSKLEDMQIQRTSNSVLQTIRFLFSIKGTQFKDKRKVFDTFTYLSEIKNGYARITYEDEPFLVPFLVKDSDCAVIVVPGGGYAYKSSDTDGEGRQGEGDLMAKELNRAGISAFVLWYRTNPYRFPIALMDMQRAVRFVRYHAAAYGIHPDKIGAVGFSAGAYEIAGLINIFEGKAGFGDKYEPDAIDLVSDHLNQAGLIYPMLGFKYMMPLLNVAFDAGDLATEEQRKERRDTYECAYHFSSGSVPQFLCYGTKDMLISAESPEAYFAKAKGAGTDITKLRVTGANHGFGAYPKNREKYGYWIEKYLAWSRHHFEEERGN